MRCVHVACCCLCSCRMDAVGCETVPCGSERSRWREQATRRDGDCGRDDCGGGATARWSAPTATQRNSPDNKENICRQGVCDIEEASRRVLQMWRWSWCGGGAGSVPSQSCTCAHTLPVAPLYAHTHARLSERCSTTSVCYLGLLFARKKRGVDSVTCSRGVAAQLLRCHPHYRCGARCNIVIMVCVHLMLLTRLLCACRAGGVLYGWLRPAHSSGGGAGGSLAWHPMVARSAIRTPGMSVLRECNFDDGRARACGVAGMALTHTVAWCVSGIAGCLSARFLLHAPSVLTAAMPRASVHLHTKNARVQASRMWVVAAWIGGARRARVRAECAVRRVVAGGVLRRAARCCGCFVRGSRRFLACNVAHRNGRRRRFARVRGAYRRVRRPTRQYARARHCCAAAPRGRQARWWRRR
jgi:hypothetical protein